MVSDVSSILRGNIKYPFSISSKERKKLNYNNILKLKFSAYVRITALDKHGVLSNITKIFSQNKISIKRIIQSPFKSKKYASIVIITHKSADELLMKMISKLTKKPYIVRKPNLIRIDD